MEQLVKQGICSRDIPLIVRLIMQGVLTDQTGTGKWRVQSARTDIVKLPHNFSGHVLSQDSGWRPRNTCREQIDLIELNGRLSFFPEESKFYCLRSLTSETACSSCFHGNRGFKSPSQKLRKITQATTVF